DISVARLDIVEDAGAAASGTAESRDETRVEIRDISTDAATVGWRDTIATLMGFIRPWWKQLTLVVTLGMGRVAAFIGVGVLGALVIAAIKGGSWPSDLVVALLVVAPVA